MGVDQLRTLQKKFQNIYAKKKNLNVGQAFPGQGWAPTLMEPKSTFLISDFDCSWNEFYPQTLIPNYYDMVFNSALSEAERTFGFKLEANPLLLHLRSIAPSQIHCSLHLNKKKRSKKTILRSKKRRGFCRMQIRERERY
ncbi:unnamed protein product [Ilex paraguariensis]|uniref:Uncharacterized protein n=1 Tax=Ilex paraguariensis TaxID=185542 RepID=A0ABC8RXP2_9AQUA